MKISELITELEEIKNTDGDLNVCVSEPNAIYCGSFENITVTAASSLKSVAEQWVNDEKVIVIVVK